MTRGCAVKKAAAFLMGLALVVLPAAGVYVWLAHHFEQQGRQDLDVTARRTLGLAESRLFMVIDALDDLAARGVRSCMGSDLGLMHETSFRIVPIKEVAIVEPAGDTRCTNLAMALSERQVAAQLTNARPDIAIDILRIAGVADRFVRVRRDIGGAAISALIPTDIMIPRTSSNGGPNIARTTVAGTDGAVLGERLPDNPGAEEGSDVLRAEARSRHFGMMVTASLPRARFDAEHQEMLILSSAGTGLGALLIVSLVMIGRSGGGDNPLAELERAIRNGELIPYYQPILDLNTGRVVSAEVLVRWRKPNGTLVPPVQFIPLAESSGLIIELTRALMRRVCAEAGVAIGARPDFRIGFNLSARHFADEKVVEDVRSIFASSPIALDQVLLEVTERQALDNLAMARKVIAALQGLGVHVGIDDLGTGHSGLSYMLKLGVDFIKIDKMFVDALETERYSSTIIETLVNLARDMKMDIIAEGVETFEQVQHLKERGIRKAQGFVFAPPLPGQSFFQLLEATHPEGRLTRDEEAEASPAALVA
jgi:sensor c-di-GMP phosphodiesterase-like protein